MREVVTYVAFDGEEFTGAERCREYEQKFSNALMAIRDAYVFYNVKGDTIHLAAYDMETLISDLESAYTECEKIVVKHDVPHRTLGYFYDATGIVLPEDAGVYKYDFNRHTWENIYDF